MPRRKTYNYLLLLFIVFSGLAGTPTSDVLSKKERKSRIKEAKAEIRKFKAERRAGNEPSTNQLLLVILAILLPPLAVYLHEGEINNKFWLDLVLTLLFFIPAVIYALIVIPGKD